MFSDLETLNVYQKYNWTDVINWMTYQKMFFNPICICYKKNFVIFNKNWIITLSNFKKCTDASRMYTDFISQEILKNNVDKHLHCNIFYNIVSRALKGDR